MKTNPWAGGLRDEIEAKVRYWNGVADPTERFSEPQVQAIVFLCVEVVDKERETFLPMMERFSAALGKIAGGVPGCDAEYIAKQALGSPSGSEGEDK